MTRLCLAALIALSTTVATSPSAQTLTPSNASKVTAIGCVAHGNTQAPTGTGATGSRIASDTKFVLTIPIVGTTAAVNGTDPTASNVRYRLQDTDEVKVSAHVGHKVEITGTVETSAASEERQSTQVTQPIPPMLRVESIKEISTLCVP